MTLKKSFPPLCLSFSSHLLQPGRICRSRTTAPYQVWIHCSGPANHLQRAPGIATRRQMGVLSSHIHKKAEKPQRQGMIPIAKIFQSDNVVRELHWSCELNWGLINHPKTNWRERGRKRGAKPLPAIQKWRLAQKLQKFYKTFKEQKIHKPEAACNQQARCKELIKC